LDRYLLLLRIRDWEIKVAQSEPAYIVDPSRNSLLLPSNLSLARNPTNACRICGVIATIISEDEKFVAAEALKIWPPSISFAI